MTTVMFDKDRVGYKGDTLPPPSTRNGREAAGVHRKTKTNTGLRMRRIAIDFSNDIAVAPNALKGQQLPAQGNAA